MSRSVYLDQTSSYYRSLPAGPINATKGAGAYQALKNACGAKPYEKLGTPRPIRTTKED